MTPTTARRPSRRSAAHLSAVGLTMVTALVASV
jgi:hypothetical protein